MKVTVKCKACNRNFITQSSWDRTYCSEDCWLMGCFGNKNAVGNKYIKRTRRACVGPECRGNKTFMSEGKHNHICKTCQVLINRRD